MPGTWLGIDTVFEPGGTAVVRDGVVISEERLPAGVPTSETLLFSVGSVLAASGTDGRGLSGIAFILGPGSYTGLRIAAATTQGLSAGWGVPVKGVPTLRLIAFGAASSTPVLAAIRARKGEVFAAIFASSDPFSEEILPAGIYHGEDVGALAHAQSSVAVGSGRSEITGAELNWVNESKDRPGPGLCTLLGIALADAEGFDRNPEPLYLRGFMQKAGFLGP